MGDAPVLTPHKNIRCELSTRRGKIGPPFISSRTELELKTRLQPQCQEFTMDLFNDSFALGRQ